MMLYFYNFSFTFLIWPLQAKTREYNLGRKEETKFQQNPYTAQGITRIPKLYVRNPTKE